MPAADAPPAPSPAVVALGGGRGLAQTLRAARRYAASLTAVVSVADDGGSSGRLRAGREQAAPGDLRKCLVAMASGDPRWAAAFEHRFASGDLRGHALGNLVLSGLSEVTGDLTVALDMTARLLGACGRVLPATTSPVRLVALAASGEVRGQAAVGATERVRRVALEPADIAPPEEAVDALLGADQVILGPGSLYTSVLAVLAVRELREALGKARGRVIYVANLRPQVAETAGYDVAGHVQALREHEVFPDVVLCDARSMPIGECSGWGTEVVQGDVAGTDAGTHDVVKLAAALADLLG